jgi:hypothetical protein
MGHLLKIKRVESRVNVHILASASVTFTLTTVQVPILALTHTKRITVRRAMHVRNTSLSPNVLYVQQANTQNIQYYHRNALKYTIVYIGILIKYKVRRKLHYVYRVQMPLYRYTVLNIIWSYPYMVSFFT